MDKLKSLGGLVALGFSMVSAILVCAVSLTIWHARGLEALNRQIDELRVPMLTEGQHANLSLHGTVESLRGWMLLEEERFRESRAAHWGRIEEAMIRLTDLSTQLDGDANERRLESLGQLLKELRADQERVENLVHEEGERGRAIELMETLTVPKTDEARVTLGEIVAEQGRLMNRDIGRARSRAEQLAFLEWTLLLSGLGLAVAIGTTITRKVGRPIAEVVGAANRIADDDFGFEIDLRGPSEIQALGRSLQQMKLNLQKRGWLIAGQLGLLEAMAGEVSIKQIARNILSYVCPRVGAQLGVLYLLEEDRLRPLAGHACDADFEARSFELGEGLVGQAALERKWIQLAEAPESYFRISSGLGEMLPRELVVVPILFGDEVLGVLELASKDSLSERAKEFLEQSTPNIGISLNLCLSSERTRRLLEEVQTQSEELQQSNEELEQKSQELEAQQEELEQTNEELEEQRTALEEEKEKLETLASELEHSRKEVEEQAMEARTASRYKSEFLANMSHELRTPLNSIMILSQLLAANEEGNLTEIQTRNAGSIHSSGSDLLNLINDILDLSKVEAGRLDVHFATFPIRDIVKNLERTFASQMQLKGLAFSVVVEDDSIRALESDQARVEQILRNLVANAMKFTEQGSVEVRIREAHSANASPDQTESEDMIAIRVEDTGIGIAEERTEFVFEAFKQIDSSLSRKQGGTGLGLSISRSLAEKLGGRIDLESEVGRGSVFTLFLPKSPDRAAEQEARTGRALDVAPRRDLDLVAPRSQPRIALSDDRGKLGDGDRAILIIEDDEKFAEAVMEKCRQSGFKCLHASDGEQGLKDVQQHRPHAVILDLRLPGLNGLSLLDRLKSDPKTRHIPVHVISVEDRRMEVMHLGAMGFLGKPVSKEQLDDVIGEMESLSQRETKNVLVVEDDAAQRDSICQLIADKEIKVKEADSADSALAMMREHHYDCLILDLKLREGSGFEIMDAIDQDPDLRKTPIVVYTGKDLTKEERYQVEQYTNSIVVKGAASPERLLDEVTLFLHSVEERLPAEKRRELVKSRLRESVFDGRRILVVDDDIRNIYALRQALLSRGFEVLKAHSGAEALETLDRERDIDIALMDVMMPEMNGIEAIRAIRAIDRLKKLPVIAITAKAMKQDREDCLKAGANDYLSKPIDVEKLLTLLRVWLS